MARARRKEAPGEVPAARAPHVVLDVELEGGLLFLVLANVGDGVAYDVRVRFSRSLRGVGGSRDLAKLGAFQGLALLRPGRELRAFLDVAELLFRRKQSTAFRARVAWRDRAGGKHAETIHHDLAIWRDWGEVVAPPPREGPGLP
ncbi:MAG TPA: hypothetical protein VMS76_05610 [Planctomycetota bacterium]|nr:hypothetical protein [Planctomycetota bacterium]